MSEQLDGYYTCEKMRSLRIEVMIQIEKKQKTRTRCIRRR